MSKRFYIALIAISVLLPLSGASCKHSPPLRTAPPPSFADISVIPLPNGTADDEALFARRVIWTYVPASWLPSGEHLVIRSAEPIDIASAIRADRYAGPGFGGTFTNDGFTSISGNDTRAPTGPTVIYLSRKIWGQPNQVGEVAIHEACHRVYWKRLTDAQRAAWTPLWGDAKARGVLPTVYAGTNEFEGFCEAGAYYLVGKLKDPSLLAWFKSLPP